MKYYADFHCHSSMYPFAYEQSGKCRRGNLWDYNPPRRKQRFEGFPKFSESDFTTLAKGMTKLALVNLYPIEQGWFKANPPFNDGMFVDIIARLLTHIPIKRINQVQAASYNYFKELNLEYDFICNNEKTHKVKTQGSKALYTFKLINTKNDLEQVLQTENTIGILLAIEGAHSFINGNASNTGNVNLNEVLANIEKVKQWAYTPFYVTLAHHFYNGFCGHARSIYAKEGFQETIANLMLNQKANMDTPINDNGYEVIKSLLSIENYSSNGKRVLIDTKHMSVASRLDYHRLIKAYNLAHPDDIIPIIASHVAHTGMQIMRQSIERPDTDDKKYEDTVVFNDSSINISDDEIFDIFESGGIMGINFDERILTGYANLTNGKNTFGKHYSPEMLDYWGMQILQNILRITTPILQSPKYEPQQKQTIWQSIALGTDFDGMINPIDAFVTAEEFTILEDTLLKALLKQDNLNQLIQPYQPEEVIRMIMYDNALNFVAKHLK